MRQDFLSGHETKKIQLLLESKQTRYIHHF